jgi:hypothetical protein
MAAEDVDEFGVYFPPQNFFLDEDYERLEGNNAASGRWD